ncbi:MAG TPA: NUDIX domain-containing protein [Terriglobales bacterium]|nr:NUDIX domain-containing protein [Terriglobales bacterium]
MSPSNFIELSDLRRVRGSEQVAAVCYRWRGEQIEILLVETDGGRWTFPKGKAEHGLTHAQTAALEAFEEAGVHGRIQETEFTRYKRRKRIGGSRDMKAEIVTHAHLCEVLWLEKPKESGRNPNWFDPEKARRRLRERRNPDDAAEHCRVLELAVFRITSPQGSFRTRRRG